MADETAPEKVVIVLATDLSAGRAANVAACLAAGVAAAAPAWAGRPLRDLEPIESVASSHLPIIVLCADPPRMTALALKLGETRPANCRLSLFPAYAQDIHDAESYRARHERTQHTREPLLGVAIAGSRTWVDGLTGSLPILR